MIVILYPHGCKKVATAAAQDVRRAFSDRVDVRLISANTTADWPAEKSWDDLLIVMYNDQIFPDKGNSFIEKYLETRTQSAILLPVALDRSTKRPPRAAEAIKALEYDRAAKGLKGRLVHRVGSMLGFAVQGRESKIFISYRAKDGAAVANEVHDYFKSMGHNVFLDQAKELDGETKILPGSPVQAQIDEALSKSNLVLLMDTPSAPESIWIMHEVDTADALLLPILPICFRPEADVKRGPRFKSLLALQRWVQLQLPDAAPKGALLTLEQLDEIVSEAEKYLCEIFQRKCRVPFLVEREFVSRGYAWSVLNEHLLMFRSSKRADWRVKTNVLSHCSIFDPNYGPAMKRFWAFVKEAKHHNFSLFLYDGELIPRPQLQKIVEETEDESAIILHHQELAALIDSNFTNLGAA
jgi:TIR domain-containing protein